MAPCNQCDIIHKSKASNPLTGDVAEIQQLGIIEKEEDGREGGVGIFTHINYIYVKTVVEMVE